jgi:hypothetical protein
MCFRAEPLRGKCGKLKKNFSLFCPVPSFKIDFKGEMQAQYLPSTAIESRCTRLMADKKGFWQCLHFFFKINFKTRNRAKKREVFF